MMARERRRRRTGSVAPKWLVDEVARRFWKTLHEDLTAARFLASTDQFALGRYCQYVAEWIALTRQIEAEGWTYRTSSEHVEDMVRPNPAVRFRRDIETALKGLEDTLGLNPRYRMALTQALLSVSVTGRQADLLTAADPEPVGPNLGDSKSEWLAILDNGGRAH